MACRLMKITLKIGDEVKVTVGKFTGKTDVVDFIDKKTKRVRLKSLKKFKDKGKKEHHGTFSLGSLLSLKPATPAKATAGEPKEEAKEVQTKTTPEPQAQAESKKEPV